MEFPPPHDATRRRRRSARMGTRRRLSRGTVLLAIGRRVVHAAAQGLESTKIKSNKRCKRRRTKKTNQIRVLASGYRVLAVSSVRLRLLRSFVVNSVIPAISIAVIPVISVAVAGLY
jgi:hypothetical protein